MERLNRARVPAIYQWPEYARLGAPLAYGADLVACRRQVAALVEKVLSGAKPAELPVEQPFASTYTKDNPGPIFPDTLLLKSIRPNDLLKAAAVAEVRH